MTAALLGLLVGLRHALDADHVAAVATIVAREGSPSGAIRVGALWGLGHSLTVCVVGGALVATRTAVPPRVAIAAEAAVVVMLLVLAWRSLRPAAATAPAPERRGPVLVGTVHGLAGSAGVALLVLTAVRTPGAAVAYLALFGAGTVLGMAAVTAALAGPIGWAARRGRGAAATVRALAAAASVGIAVGLAGEVMQQW